MDSSGGTLAFSWRRQSSYLLETDAGMMDHISGQGHLPGQLSFSRKLRNVPYLHRRNERHAIG